MAHKDQHDTMIFDRMQTETAVSNLQERVLFERSYQRQRREEVQNMEKVQYDLNRQFDQTEYANIVEKIRSDELLLALESKFVLLLLVKTIGNTTTFNWKNSNYPIKPNSICCTCNSRRTKKRSIPKKRKNCSKRMTY